MKEYDANKKNQQWLTSGDRIQNRNDHNIVLEVSGSETSEGATITLSDVKNRENQKWIFEFEYVIRLGIGLLGQ